ncbi:hypothetical protein CHS0354_019910 [Potamilus streckersoni]|uniref:Uncharacterized protein n=1 Tax=Potamilus streckersoni TaxID=2493646 RepID=A0AAE0SMT0_9BIVA|nr:hypothetical protein CHS0354_019910 [Potamilus streckersoni]
MDQKLLLFIICYLFVVGTFTALSGKGFWELDPNDQFLLIINYLSYNQNLTLKLLKIGAASKVFLPVTNPDSPTFLYLLDKLAELLQNPDFLDIATIVEDEVRKVNISRIPPDHPDLLLKSVLVNTNYPMILHRILHRQPNCSTHP